VCVCHTEIKGYLLTYLLILYMRDFVPGGLCPGFVRSRLRQPVGSRQSALLIPLIYWSCRILVMTENANFANMQWHLFISCTTEKFDPDFEVYWWKNYKILFLSIVYSLRSASARVSAQPIPIYVPVRTLTWSPSDQLAISTPASVLSPLYVFSGLLHGPKWWNNLPDSIKTSWSCTVFKSQLKTHHFNL